MKKIIFCLCALVALICFQSNEIKAQVSFSQTASNPTGTITNAGTDTMTVSLNSTASNIVGIQLTVTKTSGTVAGSGVLYSSIDGTNYVATGDTATLTNVASQSFIFTKTNNVSKRYRWLVTGSGTMVATAASSLVVRSYY
jgi:hypothetical protein